MIVEDITVEQASRIRFLLKRAFDAHVSACLLCVAAEMWLCSDARCLLSSMRYWEERIVTIAHTDREALKPW